MNGITNGTNNDKTKDWQLEILMEKLRSKSSQYKNLLEIAKNVRMAMLDKRYALDSVEKSQHQKCLDTLQHSIKVTSLQSMVERLESLTRQLGLKFMVGPSGVELFISSDMFYLEIVLDQTGAVKDVKVHHESKMEQQSCAELVSCLARGDFVDFAAQLEGFASIYQLNAEKKVKCKAFTALQSLESDLGTLAQLQSFMKEPFNLVHKSPVGVLERRRGGHPMRLTYFVTPYDLIDVERADMDVLSVEKVTINGLGSSVTVCMEGSGSHKLQTQTLITVNRNANGKSTPSFSPLTNQNSAPIPACFVLKLKEPMPMCVGLIRQIQQLTELNDGFDMGQTRPLLASIVAHTSQNRLDSSNNKGLFVTLPNQTHCYFMTENKNMDGLSVTQIPFTHPAHVSQILVILRQQALFNTLIASCVRPDARQDFESMIMFETSALSWTHITISLEHPSEESMATAEIDLVDISNLVCRIYGPGVVAPSSPTNGAPLDAVSELATKVLNRSFSIPVTMRAIVHYWDRQAALAARRPFYSNENFSMAGGGGDPGGKNGNGNGNGQNGGGGGNGVGTTEFGATLDGGKIKQEMALHAAGQAQSIFNETLMASAGNCSYPTTSGDCVLTNIELTNILAGTTTTTTTNAHSERRRPSKRKGEDAWKSGGKRRVQDDGELVETSSNDSTSRSTPISQDAEMATPLGFHSDLELSGLDPNELLANADKGDFDAIDELADVEELLGGEAKRKNNLLLELGEKSMVPPSVSITPIASASPNAGGGGGYSTPPIGDKRPGIEIIPLANTSAVTITPIATKTDEKRKSGSGGGGGGSGKTSSRATDEKSRSGEKKRKRKRDESPMGPPDKLPPKQDGGGKVSGRAPSESPPTTPTSPGLTSRKFSASPTPNRQLSTGSGSGKSSPNLLKPMKSGNSGAGGGGGNGVPQQSPKHSPAHPMSSPKHALVSISSPKSSPKHPSGGSGSGKPSLSALKNATTNASTAPSPGKSGNMTGNGNGGDKIKSKDKEKKLSSSSSSSNVATVFGVNNTKTKSSMKIKLDTTGNGGNGSANANSGMTSDVAVLQDNVPSPSADPKIANQMRNRKGSLSAIVDKLKSAQCDGVIDSLAVTTSVTAPSSGTAGMLKTVGNVTNNPSGNRERTPTIGGNGGGGGNRTSTDGGKSLKLTGEMKNSEYMVKPSSDGIKLTINKTRTKEIGGKSSNTNASGRSASPKSHTGLKPGVNSGPASKKPQHLSQNKTLPLGGNTPTNYTKKTTTPSNLTSSKLSPLPALKSKNIGGSIGGNSLKDRPKLSKSGSDKSIFSRKTSPNSREDGGGGGGMGDLFKGTGAALPPQLMVEGLMKQLDKKFQIPKLSARTADDKKPVAVTNKIENNTVDTKIFDMMLKNDLNLTKYPLAIGTTNAGGNKLFETTAMRMNNAVIPLTTTPSMAGGAANNATTVTLKEDESGKKDELKTYPLLTVSATTTSVTAAPSTKTYVASNDVVAAAAAATASPTTKGSVDLTTAKFVAPTPPPKDDGKKDANKTASKCVANDNDLLLDFSTSTPSAGAAATSKTVVPFPASPSVSVHIVKSPAPSPSIIVNPSPHSAVPSPCITDDELMDEALIGLGK